MRFKCCKYLHEENTVYDDIVRHIPIPFHIFYPASSYHQYIPIVNSRCRKISSCQNFREPTVFCTGGFWGGIFGGRHYNRPNPYLNSTTKLNNLEGGKSPASDGWPTDPWVNQTYSRWWLRTISLILDCQTWQPWICCINR